MNLLLFYVESLVPPRYITHDTDRLIRKGMNKGTRRWRFFLILRHFLVTEVRDYTGIASIFVIPIVSD